MRKENPFSYFVGEIMVLKLILPIIFIVIVLLIIYLLLFSEW